MTMLLVKFVKRKLQEIILRVTKGDVQLEHFHALIVPNFEEDCTLISTFTLQKKINFSKTITTFNLFNTCLLVLFLAIKRTGIAQRTMCMGEQNFGCDSVCGRD